MQRTESSGAPGRRGHWPGLVRLALVVAVSCGTAAQPPAPPTASTAGDDPAAQPKVSSTAGPGQPGFGAVPRRLAEAGCESDADCVALNRADCCSCCECAERTYATSHSALRSYRSWCMSADCAMPGCEPELCPACPDGKPVERPDGARCASGRCVLAH